MDKNRIFNVLKKVINGQSLSYDETYGFFKDILDHKFAEANDVIFGAFFAAMQAKGPTTEEVKGLIDVIMNYDRRQINYEGVNICGIVGSGKDDLKTFNVSTCAAIVASAVGVKVVKNGSRSESSISGTTDVLEELGINIEMDDKHIIDCLERLNLTFCDAPPFFPRMGKEYVGKFFFIHPLSYILSIASGLSFDKILFGISTNETEFVSELLDKMGYQEYIVAAGTDMNKQTIDEISIIGPTKITERKNGAKKTYILYPQDLGLDIAEYDDIKQRVTVAENAMLLKDILSGKEIGPCRDIVLMNAGALIYLSGMVNTITEGVTMARETITNGRANNKLDEFITYSNAR